MGNVVELRRRKLAKDIEKFEDFKSQMQRIRKGLEAIDALMREVKTEEKPK